ncbi:MAG TPA: ferritin-like domain-containing protein [Anseongella sp.]
MKHDDVQSIFQRYLNAPLNRKKFLTISALSGATLVLGAQACNDDDVPMPPSGAIDVGGGDPGILNFAYALEQLEAAFYIKACSSFYSGAVTEEKQVLTDIRDHEIAHRDLFKAALGQGAIPELEFDFSAINFSSRDSVLGTAKALEDTGVSAYNGAGAYITTKDYLILAGKIVSVEARHAAAIRYLLNPGSADFAGDDVVDAATGLDTSRTPNQGGSSSIVATANSFLVTKISATQLP